VPVNEQVRSSVAQRVHVVVVTGAAICVTVARYLFCSVCAGTSADADTALLAVMVEPDAKSEPSPFPPPHDAKNNIARLAHERDRIELRPKNSLDMKFPLL
jgi:hypothetical protein